MFKIVFAGDAVRILFYFFIFCEGSIRIEIFCNLNFPFFVLKGCWKIEFYFEIL